MPYCRSCGGELSGAETFCRRCGARVSQETQAEPDGRIAQQPEAERELPVMPEIPETQEPSAEPAQQAQAVDQVPVYYQPGTYSGRQVRPEKRPDRVLGAWSYVLSIFLMTLPIAGLILQIVWACGATNSLNRRNLARAYLLLTAIILVIYIIILAVIISNLGPNMDGILRDFYRYYEFR